MKLILPISFLCLIFSFGAYADEIVHKFKNPSFSGIGTGAHYLTIENQEHSRKNQSKMRLKQREKLQKERQKIQRLLNLSGI